MRQRNLVWMLALAAMLVLIFGCGGDDGGGRPTPVTGVDISSDAADIEIGTTTAINATVTGGDSKALTWSVNGIENGNEVYGTITRNSPVTYNAPDSLPENTAIVIGAISAEDETKMDTCHVHLKFTKIFVDAGGGNDATGTGSVNLPVKSITHGLGIADAGMTVLVHPGTYDHANGEIFELVLPESVALVGMDWEACVILGHGTGSYNAAVLMEERASSFRKFTLDMGEPVDPRWEIALRVKGDDQLVDSIRVLDHANYSVLRVGGTENTVIQNCYFMNSSGSPTSRGYEVVGGNDGLIIRNCTASGFHNGIFINGLQSPLIEGCLITGNTYGVALWYEPPGNDPNPDLGGGAMGGAGGNTFTGNIGCGLQNPTTNAIYARFNTWDNDPPVADVDFCNTGTGSVITE